LFLTKDVKMAAGAPVDVKLFGKWSFEDIEVRLLVV
jgi:hypothetical protein